jgi:hypothetical protein
MVLIIAAVCLAVLCFNGLSAQTQASAKAPAKSAVNLTELISDSGTNLSKMNFSLYALPQFGVAQTVKFNPPKPGWKLKQVVIFGSDGWNSTHKELPVQEIFEVEVRDENLNLLYQYADTQLDYFTSTNGVKWASIDVPDVTVNGPFYIGFYGRGVVGIGTELNKTTGNSFYYIRDLGTLLEGTVPPGENKTLPVNWLIRAYGA